MAFTMRPVGWVHSPGSEPIDDDWGELVARVTRDRELFSSESQGLDAIDGTPVLDIKPYMTEFAPREPVRQPAWSHELMKGYW